ncbi:phytanoyl-CoA dioxygenase family protein [Burkholderia ambifaria]|uniref:phytanoyl-CoA dioxygenase family protein n=1 Tax=Burkholderia ambifaria TaxID=152480 RepID=UPI00158DAAD5|nr:phytanoyl-CoA dioxygenase family protein [Burkholderia ambifaria]
MKRGPVEAYAHNGFVTVVDLIPKQVLLRLRERLDAVLARQYETGVYPDEAYYRPGSTLDNVPRHVVNAWKCDRLVARVAMSAELAAVAAHLLGWPSLRLAVDTVWYKPAACAAVEFHREFEFFKSLAVPDVANCWIALDTMEKNNGSLELAAGSHAWPDPEDAAMHKAFAVHKGRQALDAIGRLVGRVPEIHTVQCEAGACTFFDGRIWHGSEPNRTKWARRAFGVHWIRGDAELADNPHYLFGRYKLVGSRQLHESFWPIVWSADGYRTPWIDQFLAGGPLGG